MSIKIYDGMRATQKMDPFTLGVEARKILEPIFFEHVERLIAELTEANTKPFIRAEGLEPGVLNKAFTLPPGLGDRVAGSLHPYAHKEDIAHAVIEALHEHPTHTYSHASIGYDLVLLPPARQPLALVYTEHTQYRRALIESGLFEEYGYWNNTDEPDDVDPQQWRARKKAWKVITEGDATPASQGLLITHPSRFQIRLHLMGILTC